MEYALALHGIFLITAFPGRILHGFAAYIGKREIHVIVIRYIKALDAVVAGHRFYDSSDRAFLVRRIRRKTVIKPYRRALHAQETIFIHIIAVIGPVIIYGELPILQPGQLCHILEAHLVPAGIRKSVKAVAINSRIIYSAERKFLGYILVIIKSRTHILIEMGGTHPAHKGIIQFSGGFAGKVYDQFISIFKTVGRRGDVKDIVLYILLAFRCIFKAVHLHPVGVVVYAGVFPELPGKLAYGDHTVGIAGPCDTHITVMKITAETSVRFKLKPRAPAARAAGKVEAPLRKLLIKIYTLSHRLRFIRLCGLRQRFRRLRLRSCLRRSGCRLFLILFLLIASPEGSAFLAAACSRCHEYDPHTQGSKSVQFMLFHPLLLSLCRKSSCR